MFKLSVICPPSISPEVMSLLGEAHEASYVLEMSAKAAQADKNIITALVHREAIDIILEQLRTFAAMAAW